MLVLAVLAVLVLVDRLLLAEAVGAVHGSGPTRASSSSVANIEHGVLLAKREEREGRKDYDAARKEAKVTTQRKWCECGRR